MSKATTEVFVLARTRAFFLQLRYHSSKAHTNSGVSQLEMDPGIATSMYACGNCRMIHEGWCSCRDSPSWLIPSAHDNRTPTATGLEESRSTHQAYFGWNFRYRIPIFRGIRSYVESIQALRRSF